MSRRVNAAACLLPFASCLLTAATAQTATSHPAAAGIVVDEAGKPLAGVAVCGFRWGESAITADLAQKPLTRTDDKGRYLVAAPAGRPFERLVFVTEGRVHVSASLTNIGLLPVVLPKARTLAGVVRDPAGKPLAGARVEARDWLDLAPFLTGSERLRFHTVWSAVRTDEHGRFVLNGSCDTAMAILVDGEGIESLVVAPVAAGDPLDVTVHRFDPVVVTVLDGGKHVAGEMVHWLGDQQPPSDSWSWMNRTDATGRAKSPMASVRSVLCTAPGPLGGDPRSATADIKADTRSLELHLQPTHPSRAADPVTIRVVDEAGARVQEFRAAAALAYPGSMEASNLANCLRACAKTMVAARAGVATTKPVPTGTSRLCVLVDVPGKALSPHLCDLAAEVIVTLQPPALVTGTVVDAVTGTGLAGALVWTLPLLNDNEIGFYGDSLAFQALDTLLDTAVTGADGSFRLERVPAGDRHLLCVVPERPVVQPIRLRCEAGKAQDVRIPVAPMLAFTGRTDLKTAPAGLAIRFKPHRPGTSSSVEAWDFQRSCALASNGTFAASGIAPDNYAVQLLVDCGFRTGAPCKVPTGMVTKASVDTATLVVPVARALPGRLRGKVTSNVPPQRLGVISLGRLDDVAADREEHHVLVLRGPVVPVRRDGQYELLEPPGERTRLVFDLLTGVILDRSEPADVTAGSESKLDFEVAATPVEVRAGGPGLSPEVSYTVEVRAGSQWVPHGFGALDRQSSRYYVMRCRLERGQRQVTLFLPKGSFDLLLCSTAEASHRQRSQEVERHVEVESNQPCTIDLELPKAKETENTGR